MRWPVCDRVGKCRAFAFRVVASITQLYRFIYRHFTSAKIVHLVRLAEKLIQRNNPFLPLNLSLLRFLTSNFVLLSSGAQILSLWQRNPFTDIFVRKFHLMRFPCDNEQRKSIDEKLLCFFHSLLLWIKKKSELCGKAVSLAMEIDYDIINCDV